MKGAHLDMAESATDVYKRLRGMSNIPDMGAEKEKIDFSSYDGKEYGPGEADFGEPEFEFFNDDATDESNATDIANSYAALHTAETASATRYFKLIYPDNTGFSFPAYVTTTRSGGKPNDPLSFKVKLIICGEVNDVKESAESGD